MRLTRAASTTYRYVVDAQVSPRADYLATYEDLGWEHVGQMASMHIWRRPYVGRRPEAFTDSATMAERNGRFVLAAGVAASVMLVGAAALGIAAIAIAAIAIARARNR
jgi:hypothetical protein